MTRFPRDIQAGSAVEKIRHAHVWTGKYNIKMKVLLHIGQLSIFHRIGLTDDLDIEIRLTFASSQLNRLEEF
jgi:hypothetical protein